MYPEDRVLVGVINRKRDLNYALQQRWYRIPQRKMKRGIETEYVAFFLSGKVFKEQSGGIHYYSRVHGVELAHRRDLLPDEADHKRADERYYRLSLGEVHPRQPPILNPTRRPIAFIYTTWDRFLAAQTISDLYSEADHFVQRISRGLRRENLEVDRIWSAERRSGGAGLQIRRDNGSNVLDCAARSSLEHTMQLDDLLSEDHELTISHEALNQMAGPVKINDPTEDL